MQKFLLKIENLLFWLVLFLFVFIPLYPKFPLQNIPGTFVAVRLEDVIIALCLAVWGIYITLSGKLNTFFKDKLNQALLIFFFIGAVSIFSANYLTHTVISHLSLLHWLRRVEFMMLLPICATAIKNKKQLLFILITLSFVVISVNIYALGQQYLNWPVISTTNSEFSKGLLLKLTPEARVNSTFAGHYDLAVFLAMVLTCVTALFFAFKKVGKVWILILGLFSILVLIMTAARLSFVAASIGAMAALLLAGKKKFILILIIALTVILVYPSQLRDRLISTFTINLFGLGQRYEGQTDDQKIRSKLNIPTLAIKTSSTSAETSTIASPSSEIASDIAPGEPIDTTQLGVYRSFAIRLNIEWPKALNAFYKNPFLGTGYSSLGIATDNDFLRSLGEVGLLGTIAFALVLIEVTKRIFSSLKDNDKLLRFLSAGVLSMIFAFLANGLFIDVFEASKVASLFWMTLGLTLAAKNFEKLKT